MWLRFVSMMFLAWSALALRAEETRVQAQTHWSLLPVQRFAVPAIPESPAAAVNPIDAFIGSKLHSQKLKLSRPADRRTLLRRLHFDLVGLPPTPEEMKSFLGDNAAGAYAQRVEQLLASPHYGERWARHWLDAVRFGESHGFEMNQPRANAWPYRDYVIRALNSDMPYRQFIVEQIAGDALGTDEATGFMVGGAWDQVKSPDPVLTANQRADELHDIVSTTSSVFLGLTVGCARCHNHKFDPIPQTDYYAVKAVFEGVQHGERKLRDPKAEAREPELAKARQQLLELERELEQFEPLAQEVVTDTNALRAPVNARKNVERFAPVAARRLRFTISKTTDAEPCLDELEVFSSDSAARNVALATNGTTARASSVYPNSEIHRLEHIHDGRHGNSRSWISNERGQGWVELEFSQEFVINRIVWGRDREQRFADRLPLDYRIEVAVASNDWRTVASSVDRAPYVPGAKRSALANLAGLSGTNGALVERLLQQRAQLELRIGDLAKVPMIYGGSFTATPEVTHRLHRGDAMQKRESVKPGALTAIPIAYSLRATENLTDDQRRRLTFAQWVANPTNPLTARVMVNRIWQYHFGEGLVSTPSDFGANGAKPTHPELLDWLAAEFIDHGWSIKHIHRLILNSSTYQQSSDAKKDAMAIDAGSRLLWRFPPQRLDAEPIRDSILFVSGKLDERIGGPGFSFFEANDNYVRVYAPRRAWAPDTFRRMIYGTIIRQRPDGVFGAFDCPDAGQITPKRGRSTTPLQAFNLLNSSFMLQQSAFLAERLEGEAGKDPNAQVQRGFALAFQREPDRKELAAGAALIREQGLKMFCRALLNANEFVHVD